MEGDILGGIGDNEMADHVQGEVETLVLRCPATIGSAVELTLAHYADSIETLSSGLGDQNNIYTRGFIAGIRAANKVAANVTQP